MPQTLAKMIKAKYPGTYDDIPDGDLEKSIRNKYPGVYDDIPSEESKSNNPGFFGRAGELAKGLYTKAKEDLPATAMTMLGGPAALSLKIAKENLIDPVVAGYKDPSTIPESLGIQYKNLKQDWQNKDLGGGVFDAGVSGLAVLGAVEGARGLFKGRAPIKAPIPTEVLAPEVAAINEPKLLGAGKALNNDGRPALRLNESNPTIPPDVIGTPKLRNAIPGEDMGMLEAIKAEEPGTVTDPRDVNRINNPVVSGTFPTVNNEVSTGPRTVNAPGAKTPLDIMSAIYDEMDKKLGNDVQKPVEHFPEEPKVTYGEMKADLPPSPSENITLNDKLKQQGLAIEPPAPRGPLSTELVGNGNGKSLLEIQKDAAKVAATVKDVQPVKIDTKGNVLKQADAMAKAPNVGFRGGSKFMSALGSLDDKTQSWIKDRQTAPIQGNAVKLKFEPLLQGYTKDNLPQFQQALKEGKFSNVRKYFDDKLQWLKSNGVMLDNKENYLPQMWDNTAEEIGKVFNKTDAGGKRLSVNAPFTHQSVYQNYVEGIDAGLKPKLGPADLMQWYEERANKLVADRNYFNYLKNEGYIAPKGIAPSGWKTLDPDHVPSSWSKGKDVQGVNWATDPKLKNVLENYLKNDSSNTLNKIANVENKLESSALSSGIPKTGINAYGIFQAKRAFSEGGVQRLGTAIKYMVNPEKGEQFLNANQDKLIAWNKEGANFQPPRLKEPAFEGGGKVKGAANSVIAKQHEWFEKPLYEKMLPALKLNALEDVYSTFKSKGMEDSAAKKAAVDHVNTMYSSINYDLLYRNRNFQNLLRVGLLAPGIMESNAKIFTSIPKALLGQAKAIAKLGPDNPAHQAYAQVAGRMAATYMAANVVNLLGTGKPMWDNPKGHEFDIAIGTTSNGEPRYIRPFGTESDYIRVPIQVASAVAKGGDLSEIPRILGNKSSLLARPAIDSVLGTDYQGNPNLFAKGGQDKFGNPVSFGDRLGTTVSSLANSSLPQAGQAAIGLVRGQGVEKSLLGAAELPVIYGQKPKPKKIPGVSFKK